MRRLWIDINNTLVHQNIYFGHLLKYTKMDISYKEFLLHLREKILNDYIKKDKFDVTTLSATDAMRFEQIQRINAAFLL